MKLRGMHDEDFVNYKKPSMFLIFPYCDFKCDKENGNKICQNSSLIQEPIIEVSSHLLIARYHMNPLTSAIVIGGLEPFYEISFNSLLNFISHFRATSEDDIVIYTGYTEEESKEYIEVLKQFKNIIIKFGRFIPNQEHHFDEILGVELASDNQYAKAYNYEEKE